MFLIAELVVPMKNPTYRDIYQHIKSGTFFCVFVCMAGKHTHLYTAVILSYPPPSHLFFFLVQDLLVGSLSKLDLYE